MFARRFLFVSLGILALSLAYHLGARNVEAQGSLNVAVGFPVTSNNMVVLTHDGDLWYAPSGFTPSDPSGYPWQRGGNVFTGTTGVSTPAETKSSWGKVKSGGK